MDRDKLLERRAGLEQEHARAASAFEQARQLMYQLQGGIIQINMLLDELPPPPPVPPPPPPPIETT